MIFADCGCGLSILMKLLRLKVPMTVDEQDEQIAMLVQEHVENPETIVTELRVPLSPQQGHTDGQIVIRK